MNKFLFNFSYCVRFASVTALDFDQHLHQILISTIFCQFVFFSLFRFVLHCCSLKKQVYDSSVISYPQIVHQHGLITTVLGLHMQLDSSHFENGLMRVKCVTSVSPLIAMHSSSTSAEGNAAEARESSLSAYNGNNRKTNYAQRKPPLTDSREVFLIGKCIHLSSRWLQPNAELYFCFSKCNTWNSLFHCSLLCHLLNILRSFEFGSQPLISCITFTILFSCFEFSNCAHLFPVDYFCVLQTMVGCRFFLCFFFFFRMKIGSHMNCWRDKNILLML